MHSDDKDDILKSSSSIREIKQNVRARKKSSFEDGNDMVEISRKELTRLREYKHKWKEMQVESKYRRIRDYRNKRYMTDARFTMREPQTIERAPRIENKMKDL